ncbi:hypothetical protein [Amaricoccus sp.]|uniref:hypothetical protein n=1 Tax=Amaricoccus sp. TaxID=1872485 RepID=UPI002626F149|nr:hypothetical protein [Amaricoccus sp.]HRO11318.1 hypothetical protein [Amaricoccus sp.]
MDRAQGDGAQATAEIPPAAPPGRGARECAHLYLDLWERNLVHLALHAPAPAAAPASPGGRPA